MTNRNSPHTSLSVLLATAALSACATTSDPAAPALSVPTYSDSPLVNAEASGVLERDGACLRLRASGGAVYNPIWPAGTIVEGARIRLPAGPVSQSATARFGERVRLLGIRELPPGASPTPVCGANPFVVVQLKR